ncbi:hypothetical protein MMC30_003134 [Trapelia coarctata]|nr:hypothetical protein [Trapelia coarctata]
MEGLEGEWPEQQQLAQELEDFGDLFGGVIVSNPNEMETSDAAEASASTTSTGPIIQAKAKGPRSQNPRHESSPRQPQSVNSGFLNTIDPNTLNNVVNPFNTNPHSSPGFQFGGNSGTPADTAPAASAQLPASGGFNFTPNGAPLSNPFANSSTTAPLQTNAVPGGKKVSLKLYSEPGPVFDTQAEVDIYNHGIRTSDDPAERNSAPATLNPNPMGKYFIDPNAASSSTSNPQTAAQPPAIPASNSTTTSPMFNFNLNGASSSTSSAFNFYSNGAASSTSNPQTTARMPAIPGRNNTTPFVVKTAATSNRASNTASSSTLFNFNSTGSLSKSNAFMSRPPTTSSQTTAQPPAIPGGHITMPFGMKTAATSNLASSSPSTNSVFNPSSNGAPSSTTKSFGNQPLGAFSQALASITREGNTTPPIIAPPVILAPASNLTPTTSSPFIFSSSSAPSSTSNLFGSQPATTAPQAPASIPGGKNTTPLVIAAPATNSTQTTNSPFNFSSSSASSTTSNLFGSQPATTASQPFQPSPLPGLQNSTFNQDPNAAPPISDPFSMKSTNQPSRPSPLPGLQDSMFSQTSSQPSPLPGLQNSIFNQNSNGGSSISNPFSTNTSSQAFSPSSLPGLFSASNTAPPGSTSNYNWNGASSLSNPIGGQPSNTASQPTTQVRNDWPYHPVLNPVPLSDSDRLMQGSRESSPLSAHSSNFAADFEAEMANSADVPRGQFDKPANGSSWPVQNQGSTDAGYEEAEMPDAAEMPSHHYEEAEMLDEYQDSQTYPQSNRDSVTQGPEVSRFLYQPPTQQQEEQQWQYDDMDTHEEDAQIPQPPTQQEHQYQDAPMEQASDNLVYQHAEQQFQTSQAEYRRAYTMPPSIPDFLDESQKRQYVTGYRFKSLALSLIQQIKNPAEPLSSQVFKVYQEIKREIISAKGLPAAISVKRKAIHDGRTDTQSKRVNTNGPVADGNGARQPTFSFPESSGKRKSDEYKTRYSSFDGACDDHNGASDGAKRARRDDVSYPSLPLTQNPKTASLFGNIASGGKSTSNSKAKRPIGSLRRPQSSFGPSAPNQWTTASFPGRDSSTPVTEPATAAKPNGFQPANASGLETPAAGSSGGNTSSLSSASSFNNSGKSAQSSGSITANNASTVAAAASGFNVNSTMTNDASISTTAGPSASGFKFTPTNTATSSASEDSKPTAFSVPKFGTTSGNNFMAQFGEAAKKTEEENAQREKAKRKAEDFDSEDEDEAEWEQKYEKEQQAKRQKIEEAKKADDRKFVPGKVAAPLKQATETAPTSSQLETTRTTASQAPEKTNPHFQFQPMQSTSSGLFGGLKPADSVLSGAGSSSSQRQTEKASTPFLVNTSPSTSSVLFDAPKPADSGLSGTSLPLSQPQTENIFGHLSNQASDADDGKGNDDESEESDEDEPTPPKKQAKLGAPDVTTDTSNSSSRSTSRSLFDRVETNPDGTPKREIPPPTEKEVGKQSALESLLPEKAKNSLTDPRTFMSAPSRGQSSTSESTKPSLFAPANGGKTSNIFGQTLNSSWTAPELNRTWKNDSPIKFTSVSNPPSVSVTAPSPSKSTSTEQKTGAFTGLFGSPKVDVSSSPARPFSLLGGSSSSPSGAGFNFGGPSKPFAGLSAPSVFSSTATSRATSPGASTGGESANEGTEDEAPADEQVDLAKARAGEENEDILFEKKAKAREHGINADTDQVEWTVRGVGMLRVLKHRETHKARIVLRADPSGKIVLNSALMSGADYKLAGERSIMFMAPRGDGNVSKWMITVGTTEAATGLAAILEENKSN